MKKTADRKRSLEHLAALSVLLLLVSFTAQAQGDRVITFQNECPFAVWVGATGAATEGCASDSSCPAGQICNTTANPPTCFWTLPMPNNGPMLPAKTGGAFVVLGAPAQGTMKWSGNVYGSTGCDSQGQNCQTGVCVGGGPCPNYEGPVGPTTLAEFTLLTNAPDSYDVSIVNGVNVPIEMAPSCGQSFGPPPQTPSLADYFCGNPGGLQALDNNLQGCSWVFDTMINGKDQSAFLQMVPWSNSSMACSKNSDCPASQVCGLAMNPGTTNLEQLCGQQIGWWNADEVCAFTNSTFGPPYNCAQRQGANANLYQCTGLNSGSCYTPGATSTCCGCPNWTINGKPLVATMSCQSDNSAWQQVSQPWAQFTKKACPTAYSFPYDDPTSTFTCATSSETNAVNYTITYCPGGNTGFSQPLATKTKSKS